MLYKDFNIIFKQQVDTLSFEKSLALAVIICKQLYFNYERFVSEEQWGDNDLLMDAIQLCEQAKGQLISQTTIEAMLPKIEAITPHTDDFGDYNGTYALYAAAAVYETLQYIVNKDLLHVYNIGTYLINTIDCKITEQEELSDEQIDKHPMMVEAMNMLLEKTSNHRTTSALQNSGRNTNFSIKKLFGFGK